CRDAPRAGRPMVPHQYEPRVAVIRERDEPLRRVLVGRDELPLAIIQSIELADVVVVVAVNEGDLVRGVVDDNAVGDRRTRELPQASAADVHRPGAIELAGDAVTQTLHDDAVRLLPQPVDDAPRRLDGITHREPRPGLPLPGLIAEQDG